jgi:thioredoxin-dependent peroxiredoxin
MQPILSLAIAVTTLIPGGAQSAREVPSVGAPLPEFRMADQDGRWITSASLLGKRYLLAYYPKNFTPG